jgi:hypothetical protein
MQDRIRRIDETSCNARPDHIWRVSLIKGTPPKFIDFALAPDAATAEKQVAEEHKIPDTLRDRLVAIREDW